jgi:hypothetical protein
MCKPTCNISFESTNCTIMTYSCLFFDFPNCSCTNILTLWMQNFSSLSKNVLKNWIKNCTRNVLTSLTTPVGNFHTPVPLNLPPFSITTSTYHMITLISVVRYHYLSKKKKFSSQIYQAITFLVLKKLKF